MRIFKGDGGLDALYSRLGERFNVLWTSYISEYRMETNRDIEDLKRALRKVNNVQNCKTAKMVIFKGDGSLDHFCSRLGERFKVFWTPNMSG